MDIVDIEVLSDFLSFLIVLLILRFLIVKIFKSSRSLLRKILYLVLTLLSGLFTWYLIGLLIFRPLANIFPKSVPCFLLYEITCNKQKNCEWRSGFGMGPSCR